MRKVTPVTLTEHLRERLIEAQLRDDEAAVAEIRAELDRVAGPAVRELR